MFIWPENQTSGFALHILGLSPRDCPHLLLEYHALRCKYCDSSQEKIKPQPKTELRFDGQIVIVTGGGAGMGREHALLFGRRGASLVINDLSQQATESLVQEIVALGGKAAAVSGSINRQGCWRENRSDGDR